MALEWERNLKKQQKSWTNDSFWCCPGSLSLRSHSSCVSTQLLRAALTLSSQEGWNAEFHGQSSAWEFTSRAAGIKAQLRSALTPLFGCLIKLHFWDTPSTEAVWRGRLGWGIPSPTIPSGNVQWAGRSDLTRQVILAGFLTHGHMGNLSKLKMPLELEEQTQCKNANPLLLFSPFSGHTPLTSISTF